MILVQRTSVNFDRVTLADIVIFSNRHIKCRRNNSRNTKFFLATFVSQACEWIGLNFTRYVFRIYARDYDLAAAPKILRNFRSMRLNGGVDATTAWHVLQRAKKVYQSSPTTIVRVLNDLPHMQGVSGCQGSRWSAKELQLYLRKQQASFEPCCKFNLTADPGSHNGDKTMLGVWLQLS